MILPSGSRAVAEPADDAARSSSARCRPVARAARSWSARPAPTEAWSTNRTARARASAPGRGAGRVAPCRHARGAASGRDPEDLRRGGRRSGSTLQRDHGHDLPLRVRRVDDGHCRLGLCGTNASPLGQCLRLEDDSVATRVQRSRGPCRCDDYDESSGPVVALAKDLGTPASTIGVPIVVGARVWGVILARRPAPAAVPRRLRERAGSGSPESVATAMSNAVSLAELAASRARIVATADETRRRIQRDLHDGAQQRLVSLALELRTAESKVPSESTAPRAELPNCASRGGSRRGPAGDLAGRRPR